MDYVMTLWCKSYLDKLFVPFLVVLLVLFFGALIWKLPAVLEHNRLGDECVRRYHAKCEWLSSKRIWVPLDRQPEQ